MQYIIWLRQSYTSTAGPPRLNLKPCQLGHPTWWAYLTTNNGCSKASSSNVIFHRRGNMQLGSVHSSQRSRRKQPNIQLCAKIVSRLKCIKGTAHTGISAMVTAFVPSFSSSLNVSLTVIIPASTCVSVWTQRGLAIKHPADLFEVFLTTAWYCQILSKTSETKNESCFRKPI